MKYGNLSQEMINKGILGEVDGTKIVRVAPSRLPAGAVFLMTHPIAATAPKHLESFRIHDNPPGISGWLAEGRMIFDCFVFDEKVDAIYYCGGQGVLKTMKIYTGATSDTKCSITIPSAKEAATNKWYYDAAATKAGLETVTYGTAITAANWTELTTARTEIVASTNKFVRVIETDASGYPIAVGDAKIRVAES